MNGWMDVVEHQNDPIDLETWKYVLATVRTEPITCVCNLVLVQVVMMMSTGMNNKNVYNS